jgi:DNA-binding response OmpR family regulator
MTTLAINPASEDALLRFEDESIVPRIIRPQERPLLVLSDDEQFWQTLATAAGIGGRKLVKEHVARANPRTLSRVRPSLVLLDLDLPSVGAWEAADEFLQVKNCPPLLLLTSRGDQDDFNTAIQAGSLTDKSQRPARLLELIDLALDLPNSVQRERNAMQRLVIRWLKPCNWSPRIVPLDRFWGINE